MIAALAAFACTIAIALADGYAGWDFADVVLADAVRAARLLVVVALVAGLLRRATPLRRYSRLVVTVSVLLQVMVAFSSFGWWWVEPHATLADLTGSSEQARWWLAGAGLLAGAMIATAAKYCRRPDFAAELFAGVATAFLLGGGRVYRAFDQVESGGRAVVAAVISGTCVVLAIALYRALRDRSAGLRTTLFAAVGAAAVLALLLGGAGRAATGLQSSLGAGAPADSVLLIVIDTLRADASDRDSPGKFTLMPELDRIASAGTRFVQAVAPAPWTLPSTLSIVSGWNPHRHQAGRSTSSWRVLPGDPAASYLGPTLRDSGYEVAAFVHNPYLRPFYGFGVGHLLFRPYHGRAADGASLLLDWLADHGQRPFFAMLHVMDPHWPYKPAPGFGAPRNSCAPCDSLYSLAYESSGPLVHLEVRQRYNAEVSYTDSVLGKLRDELAGRGLLDHTWLIITSDHGEEFWDHAGFLHGHQLYDELLHVPLVVVPPASAADFARGRRVSSQVRLEDIAATVLDIAGADQKLARDGKSFRSLLSASVAPGADTDTRVAISGYIKSPTDLRYSVRTSSFKAVFGQDNAPAPVFFDLKSDPGEKVDVLGSALRGAAGGASASAFRELQATPARVGIDVQRKPILSGDGAGLDADSERQLRSLGYLQ